MAALAFLSLLMLAIVIPLSAASDYRTPEIKELCKDRHYLGAAALYAYRIVLPALFLVNVTWIIAADFHEAGHACACLALGGSVGGFQHWLHGIMPARWLHPGTDCSLMPHPPIVWSAGALASLTVWTASNLIVWLLLNRSMIGRNAWFGCFWGCWTFWYIGEFNAEAFHAYAPATLWEDSPQFVHAAGINPNLIGLPLAAICVISLWLYYRIQCRLLPESLMTQWRAELNQTLTNLNNRIRGLLLSE